MTAQDKAKLKQVVEALQRIEACRVRHLYAALKNEHISCECHVLARDVLAAIAKAEGREANP
jgi:hypothetical protein